MRRSAREVVFTPPAGSCGLKRIHWNPRLRIAGPASRFLEARRESRWINTVRTIATTVATGCAPRCMACLPSRRGRQTRVTRMSIRPAAQHAGAVLHQPSWLKLSQEQAEGDFGTPAARFRAVTLAWLRWLRVSTMANEARCRRRRASVVARADRIAASSSVACGRQRVHRWSGG